MKEENEDLLIKEGSTAINAELWRRIISNPNW